MLVRSIVYFIRRYTGKRHLILVYRVKSLYIVSIGVLLLCQTDNISNLEIVYVNICLSNISLALTPVETFQVCTVL